MLKNIQLVEPLFTKYALDDNFDIELCKIFRVSSNIKYLSPIYAYVHGFKLSIVEGEVDLQILMKEIKIVIIGFRALI